MDKYIYVRLTWVCLFGLLFPSYFLLCIFLLHSYWVNIPTMDLSLKLLLVRRTTDIYTVLCWNICYHFCLHTVSKQILLKQNITGPTKDNHFFFLFRTQFHNKIKSVKCVPFFYNTIHCHVLGSGDFVYKNQFFFVFFIRERGWNIISLDMHVEFFIQFQSLINSSSIHDANKLSNSKA